MEHTRLATRIRRRAFYRPFALASFLTLILLAQISLAQVEQGTIVGYVKDNSGAAIPGAQVVITNVNTGIFSETMTDESGYYRSIPLRVGVYSVSAEFEGFKRTVQSGISLEVNQQALVDLMLEIGAVTEEVTVTAEAPLLQTTEASQGQVIDHRKIVDLPLNGRDYLQLALLSSGTNVPAPGARFGGFSSGGLRTSHNNYLLDGMDNNSNQHAGTGRQGQVISPSVDAIEEFKVQTNAYSAEFGRNIGGVVNVVIKSGTNQFHGGAFEFLRNEKLDAKNFFDSPTDPVPPYKRNQFGFFVGGPIMKNKTFFFTDWEGTRIRTSGTTQSTIPTTLEREGDFSQSIYAGKPVSIYDPATYNPLNKTRLPIAGNVIPQSSLDPVGVNLASLYPLPNKSSITNNFLSNPLTKESTDKWDLKIDHTFGPSDTIYGRVSTQDFTHLGDGPLPAPAYGGGDNMTTFTNDSRSFAVSWTHVFSPYLFNSIKAGWNRFNTRRVAPIEESITEQVGIKGTANLPGLTPVGVTGFRGLGTQGSTPNFTDSQTRQLVNDLSWIKGRHTIKTGVNLNWIQAPHTQVFQSAGVLTFNGNFTRQTSPVGGGNPFADLLVGIPFSAQLSNIPYGAQRRRMHHAYVQDQIRVSDRFTLNIGIRYEYLGPWFEKYNNYSNFDLDTDPANPYILLATDGGIAERSTLTPDYNNFAPRVGIAYRVTDTTVIRSGYGIYYGGVTHFGDRYLHCSPPFFFQSRFSTDSISPTIVLKDGFPPGATSANVTNLQTISQDRRNLSPYSQQWNFTIERQLMNNLTFTIGYYGTKGNRLLQRFDSNAPDPGPGNINARRPTNQLEVPGLDYIVKPLADTFRREFSANSNHHALNVKLERRFSSGLSFLTTYIWSKTISDARGGADAGSTSPAGVQDRKNLQAEKSLADEHTPHRFVTSVNYDLPIGRGRAVWASAHPVADAVFGGWAIGGIVTLSSGRLLTARPQGDPANTGGPAPTRPNATGISPVLSSSERSLDRWFNTGAFAIQDPYTYGSASRNNITAPGRVNFDLAAYKQFNITERYRLQFRTEMFNAMNTPPFGTPAATVGANNYGVISSAGRGRIIQFGLKFLF